jgi:hypothetical protein
LIFRSSKGFFSGEFLNKLLKKADKEDFKIVKESEEKGLKTLNASNKEDLESVRAKATMKDERENFGSSVFTHV